MEGRIKELFPRERIWLWLLVGLMMIAALSMSVCFASSVRYAECEVDSLAEIAPFESSSEFVEEAIEEEEDLAEAAGASKGLIGGIMEDAARFDINNADPLAVFLANYFSGYLGQIVFFGDWPNGRSGSFGPFIGLHNKNKGSTTVLNHEHGHYEQYKQIGFIRYLFAIALPSLANDPEDYYSQPWEVTADMLGGVTTHHHSEGAEAAGERYLELVKETDPWGVALGTFICRAIGVL